MTARYIAIDWGSTNLRAWLYQGEECLESRQSEAGVTRLNGRSPAAVLAEITQHWRDGATPVVMAGMVGSNVGWKIAPYLPLPAAFSDIGQQLTAVGDNIWIIPGLCVSRDDNHNVMRGEETQLLGARALAPSSVYVMPGTHCKWVLADRRQIHDFRTVLTGELHHLLLQHSLVGAGLRRRKRPLPHSRQVCSAVSTTPPSCRSCLKFALRTCWARCLASRLANFFPAC
ncbi:2-dehydro-3-deoxygalactonokinase [Klebsiella pneumoniae]|uniref:2-dehydro-3-deoxygalactonokinase n=1 Tax=Klebsiella pneumoniae TaxID=573 RepID=A0A377UUA0_KLEPN|nr:2-dehydro-3-deoxygalactonokinase [Klebsiella pneumoniae]